MRILHVLAEKGFSGGENQLLASMRFLEEKGHEQILTHCASAKFPEHLRDLGVRTEVVNIRNNGDLLAAWELRRLYRSLAPDLVHLTDSRAHKVGSMARAFARGMPPFVVTRRMDYPIGNTPFRRWLYQRAVDAVVAVSSGVRDAVLEIGTDPSRVHLIHDGVDTAHFGSVRSFSRRASTRTRLGLHPTDFFGVTTASLHRRKAHDVLLDALANVRVPEGQRIVWLFGGEGPEKAALNERAASLPGNVEVRIPGQIDYVEEALGAADAFCLPSRYEGLGVALLEALATGVPCIASNVGGMTEAFVSGVSGLHVQPEDIEGLAGAIQSLVEDSALAQRLGEQGRRHAASRFDVSIMGTKTEALYQSLVQDRSARGS